MKPAPPDDIGPIDACPWVLHNGHCPLCGGSGVVPYALVVEFNLRWQKYDYSASYEDLRQLRKQHEQ